MSEAMSSNRPYLLRAIYDWLVDNGCTPHLVVDANDPRCVVPRAFVKDGAIVLNITPSAVRDLSLGNEWIMFSARFAGVAQEVTVPLAAVRALYARENGQGMAFEAEPATSEAGDGPPDPPPPPPPPTGGRPGGKPGPRLSVVK